MKKMSKKAKIISLILAVSPLIAYICLYSKLPDQVPMQFGFDGSVNRYGSKLELSMLPLITLGTYLLLLVVPKIDPRKSNYRKFEKSYGIIILATLLLLNVGFLSIVLSVFNPDTLSIAKLIFGLVGIVFIVIGNYMPTIKPNFFVGIKTPWTLSSDTVWIKTHRLGGYAFIGMGICFLLTIFFTNKIVSIVLSMILPGILVLIPMVMSYIYYRKEKKDANIDDGA